MRRGITVEGWNTRNGYTVYGQRIGAVLETDDTIVFVDIDRGITGVIPKWFKPSSPLRERVMDGYMLQQVEYWQRHGLSQERVTALKERATKVAHEAPPLARR